MNPTRIIGLARVLAAVAGTALIYAVAPAALATPRPRPPGWLYRPHLPAGWNKHPPLPGPAHLHAGLAAGMPGWQVIFLAVGAVLAVAVVLLARAARRRATATSA
jgi:uncharacterized oligopeptide transporter (OPT) family protein